MKLLKKIAWIFLFLLILVIVLIFVLPTDIHIQQSREIEAPKNMVFNVINELKTHEAWAPWKETDNTIQYEYHELTKGIGASYSWTSEKMGSGKYSIMESNEHTGIKSLVEFEGQVQGEGFMHIDATGDKTKVVWEFDSKMKRPSNLTGIFYKGAMNRSLKKGLRNLEDYVENRKENKMYRNYKINEVELDERHFVIKRQEVPLANVQQFYAANLGPLFNRVQKEKEDMDGMPCGLFFAWDIENGKADMAAAIPVRKKIKSRDLQSYSIPKRNALQIDYYGEYSGITEAHEAMEEYLSDYTLLQDVPVIEEYITDPGEEPDPAKWLTKLTYFYSKG